MEFTLIALRQTVVMVLLMAVGWGLYKLGKITKDGSRDLANILIYAILPCVIFQAFRTEYTEEKNRALLLSLLLSVLSLGIAILVSRLLFHKRPVDHFGAAFSNAGFMGIPMIQAVIGSQAVIFAAPFMALVNLLQWTYGLVVMTGKRESLQWKKLAANPILIGLLLGLVCFYLKLELPDIVSSTVSLIAGANTPIAMIILGVYLAQTDLKTLFRDIRLYQNAAVRLVLIPLLTLAVLCLLPSSMPEAKLAILIAASTPVGSNVAVFAQLNGRDYTYAGKSVCLSTLLSVATIPLILALSNLLF